VNDFDIVPSAAVREALLELAYERRRRLMHAIFSELSPAGAQTKLREIRRREIDGYFVDYRSLNSDEAQQFKLRSGHLIVRIAPVSKGIPRLI
jgi:hypothetical protein